MRLQFPRAGYFETGHMIASGTIPGARAIRSQYQVQDTSCKGARVSLVPIARQRYADSVVWQQQNVATEARVPATMEDRPASSVLAEPPAKTDLERVGHRDRIGGFHGRRCPEQVVVLGTQDPAAVKHTSVEVDEHPTGHVGDAGV